MIKKMKLTLTPFLLLFILGACSDNEEATTDEGTTPETEEATEETTETPEEPTSQLELPAEDEVVVVVNGEDVSGKVYNSVARQLETSLSQSGEDVTTSENAELIKSQALTVIVGNTLIVQDAAEKGHEPEEAAVDEQVEALKGQFETEEELDEALARTGFTMDDIRKQLREQMMYDSYVAEEVETGEVTDEEVQEAYDSFAAASEEAPSFEEMEPTIRQSLQEQKQQEAVMVRIEELRESADVEEKI
ncbi:SurA N-terminal domain-containing protein [Planococcus salinus]|uniref:Peptidylprolyl isomerase n=1 Tax=Planococcus salinus TaxID=1848460 RepID=A0A3M8P4V1_9BACL|nr:SurA N-terminal domain-containing protein [Planococcus salinus]RNF38693.1 peptidylprolyl isomerase [Planococcus salinus]